MATSKPSRDFGKHLDREIQPDLQRRENALKASLMKLAKAHAGRPVAVIERAVARAMKSAGLTLDRSTVKRIAMRIHLGEDA